MRKLNTKIAVPLTAVAEDPYNNNNNLILILRAFHEMIKRALHDFSLPNDVPRDFDPVIAFVS